MNVILIAQTSPDWKLYQLAVNKVLGRGTTETLDRKGIKTAGASGYLASLAEFYCATSDPTKTPTMLLRHASASFLCVVSRELLQEIMIMCDLAFVTAEIRAATVFIASGNLEQWRNAIINGCTCPDTEVQKFFNQIVAQMEVQGLGFVFRDYMRQYNGESFSLVKT